MKFVVPAVTPPPMQLLTVPFDVSFDFTFVGRPSFGSGGVNVAVPAAFAALRDVAAAPPAKR